MISLKNKYEGRKALIILGGPSLIENKFPLGKIDKEKYVVFLEPKALTPYFLESGIAPDFLMMFYPEKCKSNSFQHVVFQSILADIGLSRLIKDEFIPEYNFILKNRKDFFEDWKPERGVHKRFRYKPRVYFKNSPYDLLKGLKKMRVITFEGAFQKQAQDFNYPNELHKFNFISGGKKFDLAEYYSPVEKDGVLFLRDYLFVNSAAIALFPLLKYMGFKDASFLGMDMSMLGSMEYASCYTFKSMRHFAVFFKKARAVFNAAFKENKIKFMRPPYEFKALSDILKCDKISFTNVFEPYKYARPIEGIRNISYKDFLNE